VLLGADVRSLGPLGQGSGHDTEENAPAPSTSCFFLERPCLGTIMTGRCYTAAIMSLFTKDLQFQAYTNPPQGYLSGLLSESKAHDIVCCKLLHTEREAFGDIPDLSMHRFLHWTAVNQPLAILCTRQCRHRVYASWSASCMSIYHVRMIRLASSPLWIRYNIPRISILPESISLLLD
jgi:hypothetical protein